MAYLTKECSPREYYKLYAKEYSNPHKKPIIRLIDKFTDIIEEPILDLGCGDGLITKHLMYLEYTNIIGVDNSQEMLDRYSKETKKRPYKATFIDELPKCATIIASYSMHLVEQSMLHLAMFRIKESGCKNFIVISPFRNNPKIADAPDRTIIERGSKGIGIYGKYYNLA